MGGDHGPESVLPGAAMALKEYPSIHYLIYGDENLIQPHLDRLPALAKVSQVFHTDKKVNGDEKPSTALRASKGTSMRMAIEAVHEGHADAVVSAGNTGALMAMAKVVLKPLPGIHRPALASVFPTMGCNTIMLDLGANVLVDADNLVQFAIMGSVFSRAHNHIELPTVGLLNVGSEEMKGPEYVRNAAKILSQLEFKGKYIGFVEGDDITKGVVDVVVSDGYAGNIALKAAEGVGKMTNHYFKEYLKRDPLAIIGGLFAFFALKRLKEKVDPRLYNGGVFLGLNGLCVKSHGGCDALAFSSAVKLAASLSMNDYVERVARNINNVVGQESFVTEEDL